MTSLTFKQLEAVHQVARNGTVVKAAQSLHVTPAALTSRIKLLEEDLGLALFDRTGNRLRPTDAGREAVAAAARIDRVLSDLGDTLEAMKGLHGGRVRFGAVSTAKYFAAELIAAFLRQHAGIDLQLVVGNRAETVESLRNYEIDMAVMGRPPGDFSADSEPFGPHPYVMIASADHRLARMRARFQNRIIQPEIYRARRRLRHAQHFRVFSQRANDPAAQSNHRNGFERDHQAGRDGGTGPLADFGAHHRVGSCRRQTGRPESRGLAHRAPMVRSPPHGPRSSARRQRPLDVHREKRQCLPAQARLRLAALRPRNSFFSRQNK